ncbi:tRNA and rRNA cytosine-C5-methylase [Streptococcus sp. DD12]|nr:tRNA and rRNA cytosine-C5-methylase [Streptococcus sp. DD12]
MELAGRLEVFGDALYLVPEAFPQTHGIRIARNGLHLGTYKKKRFEPSFALGMALTTDEVSQTVSLSEENFKAYVAGHPISGLQLPNGWYLVTALGNGLGFAKIANGTLKNYYPKGLRYT